MSSSHIAIFIVCSVLEGFVSFVGPVINGTICYIFYKNPRLLTPQNIFTATISLSDFWMSLVPIPMAFVANILQRWPFGFTGCQIHAFLVFQLGLVTITHLTAATVEKYLTITKSLNSSSFVSRRQTLFAVASLWIYTLSFSVCPLLGISKFGYEGLKVSCSIIWNTNSTKEHIYFGFLFLGCFLIPLAVICRLNFCLLTTMKQMRRQMFGIYGSQSVTVYLFYKREKKALLRVGLMVVAFLVAWTPYTVVSLATIICGSSWISPGVSTMTASFAKTSCILNAIVNMFCNKSLRMLVLSAMPFYGRSNTVLPTLRIKMIKN